jgi:hypothetical protein
MQVGICGRHFLLPVDSHSCQPFLETVHTHALQPFLFCVEVCIRPLFTICGKMCNGLLVVLKKFHMGYRVSETFFLISAQSYQGIH